MKRKFLLFLFAFLFSIMIILRLVSAVPGLSNSSNGLPELPMLVKGDVFINDNPAKIGTEISAELNGKEIAKVKITEAGKFTLLLQKLNRGDEVGIYVDGIDSSQKVVYASSDFKQLSLKVEKSYIFYYIIGVIAILAILFITIWKLKKK